MPHRQVIAFINRLSERATREADGDVVASCLVIPQVGLDAPVRVTTEPWEADAGEADWEGEHGRRQAGQDGEAAGEDGEGCAIQ